MRMRRKPNLIPRLERCAHVLENSPEELRGSWLDVYPGFGELHVELGCGKGRFTCGMAELNPKVLLAAVEKVPDALVVAMGALLRARPSEPALPRAGRGQPGGIFRPGRGEPHLYKFPRPLPKKRQYKRRLTAPAFQKLCWDILRPEGEIWFKTDNSDLFEWSLEQYSLCGWTLLDVSRDWRGTVMTDYEAKFREQGVRINRLVAAKGEVFKCD